MSIRVRAAALAVLIAAALPAAHTQSSDPQPSPAGPRHAWGFDLERFGTTTLATVYGAGEEGGADRRADARYLLVPRGAAVPGPARARAPQAPVIRTPLRSVVTLSSTYLPAFLELGLEDRIVGHDRRRWVYSPQIRARMRRGEIAEVGSGGNLDRERLLALAPQVVFTYDAGTQAENPYPGLDGLDLTVVTTSEFRERTPLGRSEWILFIAAFFDREAEAARIFAGIEERYLALRRRAAAAERRPTVFLNGPWGSSWAMPEAQNYSAVFLEHAGAEYVFSHREGTGTLFLDFEAVLAAAADARFWLNPGQWDSLADGLAQDPRFRLFAAFREGRVYNNVGRTAPGGGNDYFESGYLHADRVLADLIRIIHPELMPDHELFYYRHLE